MAMRDPSCVDALQDHCITATINYTPRWRSAILFDYLGFYPFRLTKISQRLSYFMVKLRIFYVHFCVYVICIFLSIFFYILYVFYLYSPSCIIVFFCVEQSKL